MANFMIKMDSHLMMIEFMVEKLNVPSSCPFDAVICSKYITSFRFLDDEWVDLVPYRLDYKEYIGSCSQEVSYHGGKSVVFTVPKYILCEKSEGAVLDVRVHREISRYFETDWHHEPVGTLTINVDDLVNGIVEEMAIRCELANYLKLVHDQDPVCSTLKGTYLLQSPSSEEPTDVCIQIYVRLSFMGECVISEFKRMSRDPCDYFLYAKEQTNKGMPYECLELDGTDITPNTHFPVYAEYYPRECDCTDEQRALALLEHCTKSVCTEEPCKDDGPKEKTKKKKRKDRGVGTGDTKADKGVGTDAEKAAAKKKEAPKRRCGKPSPSGGQVIMPDKCRPCEPCCVPCVPCEVVCAPVCITEAGCCVPNFCSPVYCCD